MDTCMASQEVNMNRPEEGSGCTELTATVLQLLKTEYQFAGEIPWDVSVTNLRYQSYSTQQLPIKIILWGSLCTCGNARGAG
ncbi:hypothetical protein E2562_000532 [Oryza meyeriana var. granulata]|uniref:Uncharacterized protein n=1 Tax=Oryza meyeriana var. granulata TaxID=110450 RepID=A0A6G1DTQ9_9ORYZ|nr:hypothetical protein E2562_000532 [Oryza meyeriana var. granulata]